MPTTVAVLASTHLVRQSVVQSITPLGFQAREFAELAELVLRLNEAAPRLVVADIDGLEGKWRALAAALRGSRERVALVLLAGRFGYDEAHEALALGVAGMILKPYRREDHTARLSELYLKTLGLRPRRAAPRFVLPEQTEAVLRCAGPAGEERLAVSGLSVGGLGLRVEGAAAGALFAPGGSISGASLVLDGEAVPLAAVVAHRTAGTVGLRITRMPGGRPAFLHVIESQHARAFGAAGKRSRW